MLRTKRKTNPVFYRDRLERLLADEPDRLAALREEPESVDLLTWNLFASLDTDDDREFLAGQLRPFIGNDLAPPVRLSLWTGKDREPRIQPSNAYVRHIREKAGDGDLSDFLAPIEVPVRIESRNVLGLVDTMFASAKRGNGGRDRLVELVDAGLVQAERLGKELAIAVVYSSGTPAAAELSRAINDLRQRPQLAAALPWLDDVPEVRLREVPWQQLVKLWENERKNLELFNEPVGKFRAYAAKLGLR